RRNRRTTDQIFCIHQILEKMCSLGYPLNVVRLIKLRLNETGSEVRIVKHLSNKKPANNRLSYGAAFSFAVEYAIRKVERWKFRICKIILLPVVVYGCEAWSLALREEHRLRMFENRVLSRIFRSKRGHVTGGWSKLHYEELHNLYSSPSVIRMIKSGRMRWAGQVARMGEKKNTCRILVGNSEGRRPLRKPRRGWVNNIKLDLREIERDGIDWIDLAQDRDQSRDIVNTVMNLWVP
ncbi:hypothetical protein B7P43_G04554, partial [Cryptotermes secundus]